MIEYLSRLSPEALKNMDRFMYDDMCHLKPYSEKESVMGQNDVTEIFGKAHKAVDKFHFPGHVSKKCHETCDPYKMPCFDDINSPVCEQVFSRLNKFTQVKGMNESHFLFFFIYLLDLQNLSIEGRLRLVANPLSTERRLIVEKSYGTKTNVEIVEDVAMENIEKDVSEKVADSFPKIDKDIFKCEMCAAQYKHKGSLNKHTQQKHSVKQVLFICSSCGAKFLTKKQHTRHMQKHEEISHNQEMKCQKCDKKYKIHKYFLNHVSKCKI